MALRPSDPPVRPRLAAVLMASVAAIAANACGSPGPPAVPAPSAAIVPTPSAIASPTATAATEPTPTSEAPITLPPPNEFESRVIAVLTAIGVENPGVMEHGFRSAMVGGAFEGRFAHVHSAGAGSPQDVPYFNVVREITLTGGVPAMVISTPVGGDGVRFVCSGVAYEVTSLRSDREPGTGDADESVRLANLMVKHLDCT